MMDIESAYRARRLTILLPLAQRLEPCIAGYLKDSPRIDRISVRVKAVERFVDKANKKNADGMPKYTDPFSQIQDQIGARIVTFYVSDVDRVSKTVESYCRPIERQLITPESDSAFGYFGKHYILFLPTDILGAIGNRDDAPKFFELQIKTLFQHAWSEANHDLGYKPVEELDHEEQRQIAFTAAQAWGADYIFNDLHSKSLLHGTSSSVGVAVPQ